MPSNRVGQQVGVDGVVWVRSGGVDAVFVVKQVRGRYCALVDLERFFGGAWVQCVSK